jgi:tripartite-type tricarboxylate transporter receptor subunit TctC
MRSVWALAIVFATMQPALAQDYPVRNVSFIVATGAGAATDLLARILATRLGDRLGKAFVVENRPGAGTVLGADAVAKANPDGHTILMGTSTPLAINASLHKKLPYDPAKDFMPLALIATVPFVLVVNNDLPARSVSEFIALAKAKPGDINYASTAANNLLAMEMFNHMAGVKTVNIAYKGTGQAITALLSNEVQVFIISPLVGLPQVNAGKMRAIGVTGLKRSPTLPDVPAVAETLPGFESIVWHGVVAPSKTPKPIVDKLSREIIRIVRLPDVKERLNSQGLDAVGSTPEELSALIKSEISMFAKLVKQIGFKPQ